MDVIIINGPNLNLLGLREKSIYGESSFDDFYQTLKEKYPTINFTYFQSNIEGELIDKLQEIGFSIDAIILNAGGYTHTSVAIHDALKILKIPIIELHISNIYNREDFRHKSLISNVAKGVICGFGFDGYLMAVKALKKILEK